MRYSFIFLFTNLNGFPFLTDEKSIGDRFESVFMPEVYLPIARHNYEEPFLYYYS